MTQEQRDPLDAAAAAYREARAALGQYRLPEVRRHLDEAKRLLGAAPDETDGHIELALRVQLTESWLICDGSGLAPALAQVFGVAERAESAGREDLQALAHIQGGVLLARAGRFADALDQLRPAVALAHALPVDDRVRLLLNKGTIASQHGLLDEAADDLAQAARLAEALPDYAFMALHNLGFVEYLRGDLPAALQAMVAADGMDAGVDRSVSRLDRARVLMEVGLVDEAADLLAETVGTMRAAGMTDELADALLDRARCELLRGRGQEATALADEVLAIAAGREDHARALAAAAVRLESLVLVGSPDRLAGEEAARLVADAEAAGLTRLADRSAALGVLAAAAADRPLADAAGIEARLARMRRSPYLSVRLLAVRVELALGPEPGRRALLVRRAMRDLTLAKQGMASLDLRTALTIHSWPIVVEDLRAALAAGTPWTVLAATERWRRALRPIPSVVPPTDPRSADLWSLFRRRREALRAPSGGDDPAVHADVVRLERALRERSWTMRARSNDAGARSFRRSDGADHLLLSYFWLDDRLHLVSAPPGRPTRLHRLGGRSDLVELVQLVSTAASALAGARRAPLAAGIESSLEDALAQLDESLLPKGLGEGPVVIVPSGALARLPWGMLPRLRSRAVALSPSLGQWAAGATAVHGTPAVAVASGPDLPLGRDEADVVRGSWDGAAALEGRPEAVKEALTRYEVVHIAAHGQHRADNPLFSSIRLHGGDLFAHELEHLPTRSSLVVLSACGVGRARVRPGDEALGLTSSLLALGVRAVVAPLTDVPDELARDTMAALHRRLAEGLPGPEALRGATTDLLARSFTWFGSPWRVVR
ncbi:CHAT domain-containing protein [Tessaracoccus oleiagri]|uniref:CHAT domain-containing protein n=1 Tax=Tessaracoccus oleiagri TaxID=686624 RepID=A0A1G9JGE9_9ACTN|nr:CHAT domain-containing tetratricopeptide repeat protein [Tessaracoccus oleiagri]SDL36667.1 CHAT domain-containing protein [Tessaracoccus oleiagri]